MRWDLGDGANLELIDNFLTFEESGPLQEFLESLEWQQREITLYGRRVLEPRQTVWIGDPGAVYRYSGRVNVPAPWPDALQGIRRRIEQAAGQAFNSCLCNRYRDGRDSIAPHSDDEPELGPIPTIGSLSIGSSRRFQVRHKTATRKLDLELHSGSLVIMRGTMQQHYRHAVPKQPKVTQPRVNLTFRSVSAF